jgi:hypothetical protein
MIGEGECGAIGGMKIGRGNRNTGRKPAPAPLCPPQIPLDQTRDRARAATVGSQRLTTWAMARPCTLLTPCHFLSTVLNSRFLGKWHEILPWETVHSFYFVQYIDYLRMFQIKALICWVLGLCPLSCILETRKQCLGNRICFHSQVSPLERVGGRRHPVSC